MSIFYVAPDGDDANPGTAARPFRSLPRWVKAIQDAMGADPAGLHGGWIKRGYYGPESSTPAPDPLPLGDVDIWAAPGLEVRITRRKGDTSTLVPVTVNKSAVVRVNGVVI